MLSIDKTSSKPYYEQLVLSVKESVIQGVLQPGDQLPSVREAAKQLLMNPNTVSKAYKQLEAEQVIVTVKGKGTFIKETQDLPKDTYKIQQLKSQLYNFMIEARHLKIENQEILQWIDEITTELGGAENESHKSI
ncbi:GntR family transcriptional regulator [Enterococcus cecorum]|uniref:GntR family transcriptional regulator n=1 Tax=Enterococcus cecorum TaxID=44008 RepID=UPI003F8F14A8